MQVKRLATLVSGDRCRSYCGRTADGATIRPEIDGERACAGRTRRGLVCRGAPPTPRHPPSVSRLGGRPLVGRSSVPVIAVEDELDEFVGQRLGSGGVGVGGVGVWDEQDDRTDEGEGHSDFQCHVGLAESVRG